MHPPPSPARAYFTLMTECTPENRCYYSVYSVVSADGVHLVHHTAYIGIFLLGHWFKVSSATAPPTGRQLRPLSSVLYRIISKRRYILAAQLLRREKSGT